MRRRGKRSTTAPTSSTSRITCHQRRTRSCCWQSLLTRRSGLPRRPEHATRWLASVRSGSRRSICSAEVFSPQRYRGTEEMMVSTFVESNVARLRSDITPPLARIALKNPLLNIIDIPMMEELARVLSEIEARSDVSVIVLSGEGRAFSAGVDVAAHTADKVEEMLLKFHAVIRLLIASKKVMVSAVHGNCLGGGAELAMVCDLVYATASSQWGFPEIKLGCYPPVACAALAALVGQKRAAELILTGRTITGSEAAEIGLVTRAVPDEELAAVVERTVHGLLRLSPAVLALTKKAVYAWDAMHFDKGLARAEKIYLEELMKTPDAQEGIRGFMEKRPPRWAGK